MYSGLNGRFEVMPCSDVSPKSGMHPMLDGDRPLQVRRYRFVDSQASRPGLDEPSLSGSKRAYRLSVELNESCRVSQGVEKRPTSSVELYSRIPAEPRTA